MMTALFGSLKSTQSRIPPDFFLMTTNGDTQGDESTFSLMPSDASLFNSWETASLTANGSLRNWHI